MRNFNKKKLSKLKKNGKKNCYYWSRPYRIKYRSIFAGKRNSQVEIFKHKIVGGLATSQEVDGMVFDWGPHFHSNIPEITKYWRDNYSDLLLEKDFIAKNYKDGVLYDYPITLDAIENFLKKLKKVKKELSEINPENLKRARNFKECVVELVGPTLQEIFENYTKKLWGIDPENMSANWAPLKELN